ncbi:MAG: hypothetical protein V4501_11335 [Pseudomonadota bacterium]
MNELDLTPFKVEFDRSINIKDVKRGDIVLMAETKSEPAQLMIAEGLLSGSSRFASSISASLNGVEVCEDKYISVRRTILAIYRINKFKY